MKQKIRIRDRINCLIGTHKYITLIDDKKYIVKQCKMCKNYSITYKQHNIVSKFEYDELPHHIHGKIRYKSQL